MPEFVQWSLDYNRNNQIIRRPLVIRIRTRNVNCQRHSPLINQQVQLRSLFTPIGRVFARFTASQRGGNRLAVNRLPLPFDLAFLVVKLDHQPHDLVEDAVLLPGLKAFMQHVAGYPEPVFVNGFPLATGPQVPPSALQFAIHKNVNTAVRFILTQPKCLVNFREWELVCDHLRSIDQTIQDKTNTLIKEPPHIDVSARFCRINL